MGCMHLSPRTQPLQVRFGMRLTSTEELWQLAGMGIPCHHLRFPPLNAGGVSGLGRPTSLRQAGAALQAYFDSVPAAATRLLASPRFLRHSSRCLLELVDCPIRAVAATAQAGILRRYSVLMKLAVLSEEFVMPGLLGYRTAASQGWPSSLQEMRLTRPNLNLAHDLEGFPANLRLLRLTAWAALACACRRAAAARVLTASGAPSRHCTSAAAVARGGSSYAAWTGWQLESL